MLKKLDYIDIGLILAFIFVVGTICYMSATGQAIPEVLSTIFWALAVGLGLKKTPTLITPQNTDEISKEE